MTRLPPDDLPLGRRTEDDQAIDELVLVLRSRIGADFSQYKRAAMRQRLARRMNALRIRRLQEYVRFAETVPSELEHVVRDLLVNVTAFFRDANAFDRLRDRALIPMIDALPDDHEIRGWVPGCATGEEAYSIAMILMDVMRRRGRRNDVRIFATDVNASAIEAARLGLYSKSAVEEIDRDLRRRFFEENEDWVRPKPEIRHMVVFAHQNVLQDPPITKLDLLSCRNLLIYIDVERQKTLMPTFHYALNPGGVLFLGSSESLGAADQLFDTVDREWRIYRRRDTQAPVPPPPMRPAPAPSANRPVVAPLIDRSLLPSLVPPAVLVDSRREVLFRHGDTLPFLESVEDRPGRVDVLRAARPELRPVLEHALAYVAAAEDQVLLRNLEVRSAPLAVVFDLRVRRILEPAVLRGMTMISFETVRPKGAQAAVETSDPPGHAERLQRALDLEREQHEIAVEELKTTIEELEARNEEYEWAFEELQGVRELLDATKEQLRSHHTLLAETKERLEEMRQAFTRSEGDLKNLTRCTRDAVIFLDEALSLRRVTPRASELTGLEPSDIGRPAAVIAGRIGGDILEVARTVLQTAMTRETKVFTREGARSVARIGPYRTTENVIRGVVITLHEGGGLEDD